MNDDLTFTALDGLADLPGAALRLGLPLFLAAVLCLVVLLGAIAGNPAAILPEQVLTAASTTAGSDQANASADTVDAEVSSAHMPAIALPPDAGELALGLAAVQVARAQIGKPYVWGAAGPNAFDCSGLVMWAWAQVGVSLPHFTVDQYNAMVPVPLGQVQPGDLVFLQHTYAAPYAITHVGMVTERGTVIEAPEPGVAIREVPLASYVATNFYGAARPRV